jgi:hypothetical protein
MSFDPTTWIDVSRAAGNARSNVFADILKACADHRSARMRGTDDGLHGRRVERVSQIKREAADHDSKVWKESDEPPMRETQKFSDHLGKISTA